MRKNLRGHVFNIYFLFTLCFGFAFSATHAQLSGSYTINSAVVTGGSNFQSFTDAATALAGGITGAVTFNVQAGSGPYNEQVLLTNIASTAANTVTFNCNGVTLTFSSSDPSQRAVIKLNNTDYVTFDNLTVNAPALSFGYGYGFHLLNDADHNTIKNCRITIGMNLFDPYATEGIVINGNDNQSIDEGDSKCDDNLIQGNTISGGGNGISIMSTPPFGNQPQLITGNKVLNNKVSNTVNNCIQVCYTSGTLVNGNEIVGGFNNNLNSNGIFLGNYNESVVISNNRIHDINVPDYISGSEVAGIYVSSQGAAGKENLVANNLIYNFICDGTQSGIAGANFSYLNIYNNTISLDDQTLLGFNTYGIYFTVADNVTLKNNIVKVSRSVIFVNRGFYLNGAVTNFVSEHNDIYLPSGSYATDFGYYVGNRSATLADWRNDMKADYFSTDVDPGFTNPAAGNFKPTAPSIDNMAVYVNINNDIDNVARNTTTPDPGCLEFASATACSTPVIPGTTFVTPDSSMCVGPKISLGVNGNSSGAGQTYTWQTATTAAGPFTNLTSAIGYPYYEGAPLTTLYYRVATTCGGVTAFSNPVRVLVTSPLNAGTYTINNTLPTSGVNFNSFNDMEHALECGINGSVVFNVAGNTTYNEQVRFLAVNTSPTKTVTINGNGATISFEPASPLESAVIKLDGTDYFTIDSLTVEVVGTTNGFGFGIQLTNDADHNTIKRCTVNLNKTSVQPNYAGIVMNGDPADPRNALQESYCDSNLVTGNKVMGGAHGIACATRADNTAPSTAVGNIISRNILTDNAINGIYITGVEKLLVDSNDIFHTNRSAFPTEAFAGVFVRNDKNHAVTITRNKIHDIYGKNPLTGGQATGVRFEYVTTTPDKGHLVSNNEVYNLKGKVIQEGLYALNSNYIKFYHNSISLEDSTTSSDGLQTRGISLFTTGSFPGLEIKDNNVVIRRNNGTAAEKYCVYMLSNDPGIQANYNNYYLHSPSTTNDYVGFMAGTKYKALTNWLASRKDSGSLSIDPVYNDLAKGDLTPTRINFENKGSNVGITNDLLNASRNPSTPDIGAIEFTICSPLTNPVVSVEDAQPNTIKFAWNAVTNTTGYRVSRDNLNWAIPSSGALGLNHIVTGLKATDSVTLWVKALGTRADCPDYTAMIGGKALSDGVFVPNTFTPNNDAHNDFFQVYSAIPKSIRWMVFNQWGEKIFESNDINGKWDGTYKGKAQPVGVYVYAVSGMLANGTKISKKGTFNLVR